MDDLAVVLLQCVPHRNFMSKFNLIVLHMTALVNRVVCGHFVLAYDLFTQY